MNEIEKLKKQLENFVAEAKAAARERGVDFLDAETTGKIKEMAQRITSMEVEQEAQDTAQTQQRQADPEREAYEARHAQANAAIADFVHWVTHDGVRQDGQYRPTYTIYVDQGIPDHAIRAMPILSSGWAYEESEPEAAELTRAIMQTPMTERALSSTTTAVIPGESVMHPVMAEYEGNPLRATPGVRIFATADGVPAKVPIIKRGTTWDPGITAEAGSAPERDPSITSAALGAHVYRVQITLTRELLQDNAAGLMGLLPQFFTEVFQSSLGSDCTTGVAKTAPQGIVTAAPTSGQFCTNLPASDDTSGDDGISAKTLRSFVSSMPHWYKNRAWIHMHQDTFAELWALTLISSTKTGASAHTDVNASWLLNGTVADGAAKRIYSVPVMLNNHMYAWPGQDKAAADAKILGVMFDPGYYIIRDIMGITFELDRLHKAANFQNLMHVYMRADAVFADPGNGAIVSLRQTT